MVGAHAFSFQRQGQHTNAQSKSGVERAPSGNRQRSNTGNISNNKRVQSSSGTKNHQTSNPNQKSGRFSSVNRRTHRINQPGGGNAQPQQFNLQRQSVFQGPKNSKFFERESSGHKDGSEEKKVNNDHVEIQILEPRRKRQQS